METKKCGKCGQVLPVSEFYKKTASKDGYQYVCKKCAAAYAKTPVRKQKVLASQPLATAVASDSVYKRNPALAGFQPRELIEELRARNYRGKLIFTKEIIV